MFSFFFFFSSRLFILRPKREKGRKWPPNKATVMKRERLTFFFLFFLSLVWGRNIKPSLTNIQRKKERKRKEAKLKGERAQVSTQRGKRQKRKWLHHYALVTHCSKLIGHRCGLIPTQCHNIYRQLNPPHTCNNNNSKLQFCRK